MLPANLHAEFEEIVVPFFEIGKTTGDWETADANIEAMVGTFMTLHGVDEAAVRESLVVIAGRYEGGIWGKLQSHHFMGIGAGSILLALGLGYGAYYVYENYL